MKSLNAKVLMVGAALILAACGQSFNSHGTSAGGGSDNKDFGSNPTPIESIPEFKGIVESGTYMNQQVIGLDPVKKELLLKVPLGLNLNLTLLETPIPDLPGARVYTAEEADGKKSLVLAVPLKHVFKRVASGSATRLPNGDPLPHMPGGEPAEWGLIVNGKDNAKIHIYAGYDSLGVFVESSFNPYIGIGWDIRDKYQGKVGILALIPEKGVHQGGFFLGTKMPDELARLIDKLIQ